MADKLPKLQEQVLNARTDNTPLVIQGGGSKQDLGRYAPAATMMLHDHTGVVDYSPAELVLRVRSGTSIRDINTLLAENNQRLGFEPPEYNGLATIGGTVATNQSGPATPWFGGVKDSILGIGLINGRGESIQFGGQVMKNVAGFDVSRLQVGAFGVLGIITEVSLKVLPILPAEATLVIPTSLQQALIIMPTFLQKNLPVTGVCYWQNNIYVRFQGLQSAIDAAIKTTQSRYGGVIDDPASAQQFWLDNREQQLLKVSVAEQNILWLANVAANNNTLMMHESTLFNWAGAQRWQLFPVDHEALDSAVAYRGGDRHGEVHLEANGELTQVNQAIQKRLKAAFDPDSIFNLGRLYSWM